MEKENAAAKKFWDLRASQELADADDTASVKSHATNMTGVTTKTVVLREKVESLEKLLQIEQEKRERLQAEVEDLRSSMTLKE